LVDGVLVFGEHQDGEDPAGVVIGTGQFRVDTPRHLLILEGDFIIVLVEFHVQVVHGKTIREVQVSFPQQPCQICDIQLVFSQLCGLIDSRNGGEAALSGPCPGY
jgi:hypothetical protein